MEKHTLSQYIDACELIKETEEDITRLKKRRRLPVRDSVKGSMHEFPYAPQNFHIEGLSYSFTEHPSYLEKEEELLKFRKKDAEGIKLQVEAWMNTIPQRAQRIIRMKFFEERTWGEMATRLGRKAAADSVRMEFNNFMSAA